MTSDAFDLTDEEEDQEQEAYERGEAIQPDLADALLSLALAMSVLRPEGTPSPWGRDGRGHFENPVFAVRPYDWGEEDGHPQYAGDPEGAGWNFKWRDVRVSWYKHLKRGARSNRTLPSTEVVTLLRECLASLLQ